MSKPLPDDLIQQVNELKGMGEQIDQLFVQWQEEDGSTPEETLEQMAHWVTQANHSIKQLVVTAEQMQVLRHPELISLKEDWTARFARLEHHMEASKQNIGDQLTNTTQRHRAADAYLKNQ